MQRCLVALFLAMLAAAVSLGGPAIAQSGAAQSSDKKAAERELRSLERALELDRERQRSLGKQTKTLSGEIGTVRKRMVTMAEQVQRREGQATALEAELAQLSDQETETAAWFEERRGQLVGTLGALERMAQRPPEALIAIPTSPVDTLRSAFLLRSVVPGLEADARQLREDVAALQDVRSTADTKRKTLQAALEDLRLKRTELAALHDQKNLLKERAEAESRDVTARLARMGQEATDLQDLLRRLEVERKAAEAEARKRAAEAARRRAEDVRRRAAEATRRLNEDSRQAALQSDPPPAVREPRAVSIAPVPRPDDGPPLATPAPAQGSLRLPAEGRIVSTFGSGSGPRSRGITIAARPGAQVVAPYEGRIAYAGPFRGYGLLLIITHGGGYHSLLTGLSRLDSAPGQWVLAGEPVGVMETSGSGDTKLYVELRHNGQPINPIPWLTARKG